MKPFPTATFEEVAHKLLAMSNQQIAPHVREKIKNLVDRKHSPTELYDLLVEISDIPIIGMSPKVAVGDISNFVKRVCNIEPYYMRPE